MKKSNWTREQTIVAFNVYCKIPFKSSSSRNPDVIKYAKIIGRSPAALNMKIGNFGRLDPQLKKRGISGLSHGGKLEKEIWDEFQNDWESLAYESEVIIAKLQNKKIENTVDVNLDNFPTGIERERVVKSRVNQNFFRSAVLAAYNCKCCITGLPLPELLIASHIVPWHKSKKDRLSPENGLCLNALHDKAFDVGLITVSTDYKVVVSSCFEDFYPNKSVNDYFLKFHNKAITKPDKFPPQKEFLEYHNRKIFKK